MIESLRGLEAATLVLVCFYMVDVLNFRMAAILYLREEHVSYEEGN